MKGQKPGASGSASQRLELAELHGDRRRLGVNGLGRIGKLSVWFHVHRKHFEELVVNTGRPVGSGMEAVAQAIERDSTYGPMHRFLHGAYARPCIEILDEAEGRLMVDGMPVRVLRSERSPRGIDWRRHGVRVVVDTTGAYKDPTVPGEHPKGALRGHLAAGAEKVVISAPFKIKQKGLSHPEDAVTLIHGMNHAAYDPSAHSLISAASCTTTALAFMVRPLLDDRRTAKVLVASMSTVHAATNSQSVLDQVPKAGATDLRKTRSVLSNIILTSTGAARTLEQVVADVSGIGFMADSVRVPTSTESLIILNLAFQTRMDDRGVPSVTRDVINSIYADAAAGRYSEFVEYSESQNVSTDVIGNPAAVVIEGAENHTRTSFLTVDLGDLPEAAHAAVGSGRGRLEVPVTHAKIFGWYDNEFGSYVNRLGELTCFVESQLE